MIREHEDAGDALARIRTLTDNFVLPADACNTYRALFDSLQQLERDMHQHVHKENNILFPKAIRQERLLAGRTSSV
jgi:regulator of cell morphogenesis and NO signaling